MEYYVLFAAAYVVPKGLVLTGRLGAWALLPLLTVPAALALARAVARERGAPMNRLLFGTARLELVFGLLFAVGIALGATR